MNVQWYPGHMTKAKRQMQEDLKLIDLIIELVDARVPLSSRNPDIDQLGQNKSRLILLNKADLADERQNEAWKEYFQKRGFHVVKVDSRNGSGMKTFRMLYRRPVRKKLNVTAAVELKTVQSVQWWLESPMLENLRLLIHLREKHVQRPETDLV